MDIGSYFLQWTYIVLYIWNDNNKILSVKKKVTFYKNEQILKSEQNLRTLDSILKFSEIVNSISIPISSWLGNRLCGVAMTLCGSNFSFGVGLAVAITVNKHFTKSNYQSLTCSSLCPDSSLVVQYMVWP